MPCKCKWTSIKFVQRSSISAKLKVPRNKFQFSTKQKMHGQENEEKYNFNFKFFFLVTMFFVSTSRKDTCTQFFFSKVTFCKLNKMQSFQFREFFKQFAYISVRFSNDVNWGSLRIEAKGFLLYKLRYGIHEQLAVFK